MTMRVTDLRGGCKNNEGKSEEGKERDLCDFWCRCCNQEYFTLSSFGIAG